VIDPGPDGSIGNVSWIAAARREGKLPLLVVQGVVMTELAAAADCVLPGAAYVEKDAIYTNDQGRVQGAARAILPPGEAREDWQILANFGSLFALSLPYRSSDDVRRALAVALPGTPYAQAAEMTFARAMPARSWLQASNPSERWKWDFMYQDLPPVKGHNVQMEGALPQGALPLIPVGNKP
jgi:NADH-quinone oxidoreductase subunit G